MRKQLKVGRVPLKERTKAPDDALPYAVNHTIRVETLAVLHIGEYSAGEVAEMIGEDVKHVSNHIHELYEAGCIEFVGRKEVGNFLKPVYRALILPEVSDDEYRSMSLVDRHDVNGAILQWFFAECSSSYRRGTMDRDEDLCLIWYDPTVDAEGKGEVRELFTVTWRGGLDENQVRESIQSIECKATNRMAKSGEEGIQLVVGLFAFERARKGRPKCRGFGSENNNER